MNDSASPHQGVPEPANIRSFIKWLLVSELFFIGYAALFLHRDGHLPPPFFYNASDTFMDFFNTNFWAHAAAPYQDWHAIYPIFTFLVARLVTPDRCLGVAGPHALRACATSSIWLIVCSCIVGAGICGAIAARYVKLERRLSVAAFVGAATLLSLPSIFALERGNYILVAFVCVAVSAWSGRNWKGALWLAAAINFKPYLVVLWLVPLVKRRYDYLAVSILFVLAVNALAMLLVGYSHYYLLLDNIRGFASTGPGSVFQNMWYATAFSAWAAAVASDIAVRHLNPVVLLSARVVLEILRWVSVAVAAYALVWVGRAASRASWELLSLVVILALLAVSSSPSGYALLFTVPFIPSLIAEGLSGRRALLLFIVFTPLDWGIGPHHVFSYVSYLTGRHIDYLEGITALAYVRPAAVLLLLLSSLKSLRRLDSVVQISADTSRMGSVSHQL